eukprot:955181-Pleurochrysis_carterae.AAC.1
MPPLLPPSRPLALPGTRVAGVSGGSGGSGGRSVRLPLSPHRAFPHLKQLAPERATPSLSQHASHTLHARLYPGYTLVGKPLVWQIPPIDGGTW